MVGRTNAGGGGGQKYLTGSFTSTSGTSQKSFTVAGLDFEPKLLIIRRTSYVNVKNTPDIVCIAFKDFERDICACVNTAIEDAWSASAYHPSSPTITLSKSGDVTTVTLNQPLSGDSFEDAYGNYNYYFYG